MSARTPVAVALAIACVMPAGDDGRAAAPEDPEVYKGETTAVVVDVVVRDRRGRAIVDLQKRDFELAEDGVPQKIGDVTLVAPGGARQTGRAAPSSRAGEPGGGAAAVPDTPTFLAVVFEQMSLEARAVAHKGALAYLEAPGGPGDFAGVFLVDPSLQTIESFTNDPRRIRAALDRVASRPTSGDFTLDPLDTQGGRSAARGSSTASAEFGNDSPRAHAGAGAGPAGDIARALVAHAEQMWMRLERERQGYATTRALRALTSALGTLPGRKTIVFFSEGLSLPDAVMPHFHSVIAEANAANVSIYTIDAAGLRVHSELQATAADVRAAGRAGLTLNEDGSSQSDLRTLEANEFALRRDPHVGLTVLARETGGFLIDSTNDLRPGFRDIDADRRFHYLLTYMPTNLEFRGEWRKIEVKVKRRGARVRSRGGYTAVARNAPEGR